LCEARAFSPALSSGSLLHFQNTNGAKSRLSQSWSVSDKNDDCLPSAYYEQQMTFFGNCVPVRDGFIYPERSEEGEPQDNGTESRGSSDRLGARRVQAWRSRKSAMF
jgi:hypothetical protein